MARIITPEGFSLGGTEMLKYILEPHFDKSDNRWLFRAMGIPPSRMLGTVPIILCTLTEMEMFDMPLDVDIAAKAGKVTEIMEKTYKKMYTSK